MIRRLGSDLESFKILDFGPGLNILLADKSEGATDLQSRNGAGKTSFVDTVHFLTGGKAGPDSIFRSDELINSKFDMQMDVGGDEITVERSGAAPSKVYLNGPVENWPIPPKFDEDKGVFAISNANWTHTLGAKWFGLEAPSDTDTKFQPTFSPDYSRFSGCGSIATKVREVPQARIAISVRETAFVRRDTISIRNEV